MGKVPLKKFAPILPGLLLVLDFLLANAFTDTEDVFAINVLYTSLGSPPLPGWIPNAGDPCGENWQGVQCVGPNITAIILPGANLGGQLGYGLENLTSLITLDLSNNHIGDVIPYQLPPHLQRLFTEDMFISGNQFTGNLPYSISTLTLLSDFAVNNNHLTGAIPDIFQDLTGLINLDLSFNNFSGGLPKSLSILTSLTSLHLQNNQLSGPIDVLENLPLKDLNIENNLFTGWIPSTLLTIPAFKKDGNRFNTSPAPPPPPLTPPPDSTSPSRNPGHSSSPGKASHDEKNDKYLTSGRIAAIAVAGVLTVIAAVLVIIFFVTRKHEGKLHADTKYKDREKRKTEEKIFYKDIEKKCKAEAALTGPVTAIAKVQKENVEEEASPFPTEVNLKPPPVEKYKPPANAPPEKPAWKPLTKMARAPISATAYTVGALQQFTNSFGQENLIGEGSLGRVYRAELPDGKLLAVKKLDTSALMLQKDDDFLDLVSNISRLRHSNIIELVGYCLEHGQRLLVYEYVSNVTLHDALHSGDELSKKLSWNARVKIALGAARALEYLHEVCQPAVVHRNFKSANILLDDELGPHLSDCGLAILTSFGLESQVSAHMLGSFGYSAPEFAMSGVYTIKSDVYSFGVVMLELLTGRKPLDSSRPRLEQSLVRWATPQLHDIDALAKMVDPALNGIYPAKSLSRFADIISLCIQPEPEFRPPISEVVQALVRLMQRATLSKRRSGEDSGSSHRSLELLESAAQE